MMLFFEIYFFDMCVCFVEVVVEVFFEVGYNVSMDVIVVWVGVVK